MRLLFEMWKHKQHRIEIYIYTEGYKLNDFSGCEMWFSCIPESSEENDDFSFSLWLICQSSANETSGSSLMWLN